MPVQTLQSVGRALRGLCPACGEGALFQGVVGVKEVCPACGVRHDRMEGSFVIAFGGSVFLGLGAAVATLLHRYQTLNVEGLDWKLPALIAVLVLVSSLRVLKSLMCAWLHRMGLVTPDPVRDGNVIFLDRVREQRSRLDAQGDGGRAEAGEG